MIRLGSRHRLKRILAVAVCTAAVSANAASAQDRIEGLDAAQLFELADGRKDAGAIDDALTLYDALSQDPDSDVRAEARYRKGLLLADLRRFAEAAITFRALLDEKPNALAARLELARMLAALGRESDARRELRQAQAIGIPPDAALMVDRFAGALRSPKRFGGSIELALAPDTNINRATDARTLDTVIAPLTLSEDARAKSGLGGRVAAQAFGKLRLTDHWSVLPRVSGLASLYQDNRFNDVSSSALIGLEWRSATDKLSPSIGQTYRWFGNQSYAQTKTFSLDWVHAIDPRSQLVASASASEATYEKNELQNGAIYDVSTSYERALTGTTGASLAASVTRQTAHDPGYSTWAGGVTVGAWREMRWGTAFASSGLRRTEGDARLFLFTDRRREWLISARAGMNLRALAVAGFAPTVRVSFERNISTVGIYDYQRVAAELGVVRAF